MRDDERGISIEELADRAGVPVRTVRFYVTEGLLPGPGARGKAAAYGDEHLSRLLLVRRLTEQRVPLAEIRERMAGLTLEDVRGVLAQEERHVAQLQQTSATESPADYLSALLRSARAARERPEGGDMPAFMQRSAAAPPSLPTAEEQPLPSRSVAGEEVWQRWQLAPGVELHVRADALRRYRGVLERLRAAGKTLFGRTDQNDRS